WPYTAELFSPHDVSVGVDPQSLRTEFDTVIAQVFDAARLTTPEVTAASGKAGRDGGHTEAMGVLLAEMQSVARAHPGATW
ncbi:MAG TPA: Phenylacetic acid catabolic protein, partial [Jatrophihabitantaceae bacterium]|nr:Phenylacetic acid catabolic protein [Jatrophihabitantaceae bacterium]